MLGSYLPVIINSRTQVFENRWPSGAIRFLLILELNYLKGLSAPEFAENLDFKIYIFSVKV